MRRGVAVLIGFTLIVALSGLNSANGASPISSATTRLGMYLDENLDLTVQTSAIYGSSTPDIQRSFKICKSVDDDICTAATDIVINQYFDLCREATDINCIQEVWARNKTGGKITGIYQRHIPSSGTGDFPAAPSMKLPAGKGSNFLVRFPGVVHSGRSDEYLVGVKNRYSFRKPAGASPLTYQIEASNLMGAIAAVTPQITGQQRIRLGDGFGSSGGLEYSPSGDRCLSVGDDYCAAAKFFPEDHRFGLTLRLSNKLNGWFHGRIRTPAITTEASGSEYLVSLEAAPVRVAALDFLAPISEVDQRIKDRVFSDYTFGHAGNEVSGVRLAFDLNLDDGPLFLQWFSPNYKDTATRTNEYWTFRTLTDFRNDALRRCSDNSGELAGVVTTNALLYSSGPPTYNAAEGTLDYKVAAPHYESNGKEASGSYDLLLRSDVARCIYGFTEAPIKASLEVVSSDGEVKVATTAINERNGWLTMSANGFGFSAPIVRAKLSQEKPQPVVTPTPTPSASSTAEATPTTLPLATKKTKSAITCIKGVQKKKVAGVKPKCPKGWKRVANT